MKHSWHVQRDGVAVADGQRRWDQAFHLVLQWTGAAAPPATLQSKKEVANLVGSHQIVGCNMYHYPCTFNHCRHSRGQLPDQNANRRTILDLIAQPEYGVDPGALLNRLAGLPQRDMGLPLLA